MNYTAALSRDDAPLTWLAVRVKRAMVAERRLEAQGYEVYYPQCELPSGRIEPLFPGYLFAGGVHHVIRHIRNTPGVCGIVRGACEEPTPLRQKDIDALRKRENGSGLIKIAGPAHPKGFVHGERVKVLGGAWMGHSAIFDEPDGKERSRLLIYLFGAERSVPVENKLIGAV